SGMSRLPNPPEYAWPARFAYTYGWRVLDWLLEGHAKLRETLTRVWPRGVRRALHLTERIAEIPFVIGGLRLPPGSRILDVGSRWSPLPLVLTVPYGIPEEDRHQRAYDRERLGRATGGWTRETERYSVRQGSTWREGTEAEASIARSIPETQAVAMLVLRRPG